MKITVYSIKGGAGKTPISTNISLDFGYCVGTNESVDCYSDLLEEDSYIMVGQNEEFPVFTDDTDVVFDLSGSISDKAVSITSAVKQSDIVIVPIYNKTRSLQGGITTILELINFDSSLKGKIIVVATQLQKSKKDSVNKKKKEGKLNIKDKPYDWTDCDDFKNISRQVKENIDFEIPIIPLKFSNGFDLVDDEEMSILQLVESRKLYKHFYKTEAEQLQKLYDLIQSYE